MTKILFGVSSVGLGHAKRSLCVAQELRKLEPVQIDWLTAEPVISFLKSNGEPVLENSKSLVSLTEVFNQNCEKGKVKSVRKLLVGLNSKIQANRKILYGISSKWNLVVCDEFWELMDGELLLKATQGTSVFITDFLKFGYDGYDLLTRLTIWAGNRQLHKGLENFSKRILLFGGESLGKEGLWYPFGPRLVQWASERCMILPNFSAPSGKSVDRNSAREELGFRHEDFVVTACAGGSSVGRELLVQLIRAADRIAQQFTPLKIVVICGPFIEPYSLPENKIVQKVGFVQDTETYFAASDCVVTLAGLATLLELDSLGIPAVIVPIKNHFEQEANATIFASKAGNIRLSIEDVTPEKLVVSFTKILSEQKIPFKQTEDGHWAKRVADAILSVAC